MKDIYFYDFDFNLLGIEKSTISSVWSINFDDAGTFEAVFPISSDAVRAVLENDYVLAVQGESQAVITGKIISDVARVYGKTPNWLLSKRLIEPTSFDTDGKDAVKSIMDKAFYDVENFEMIMPDSDIGDVSIEIKSHTTALDAVKRCLSPLGIGYRMYADIGKKMWKFYLLTKNDTDIVMSEDLKNVHSTRYSEDIQNLFTDGIYKDENGTFHTISSGKAGITRWECFLDGDTEDDATDSLASMKKTANSQVMTRDFEFGRDFFLGDRVKVRKSLAGFERLTDVYISGVNIWYDKKVYGAEPVFKEN